MAKALLIGCAGLMTDANAIAAPVGALRVADDIIIERPGVASARPGWSRLASLAAPSKKPAVMAPALTSYLVQEWVSAGSFAMRIGTAASALTGNATPLDYTLSFSQIVQARDNVYFTTNTGPRKISAVADTASVQAGLHEPMSASIAQTVAATGALPTNYATAYRFCFKRVDGSGLETRSSPSPWQLVANNSGGQRDVLFTIPLPAALIAGDQIELYRAIAVTPYTAVPSDTLYLAVSQILTTTDVTTNGYVEIRDRIPEAALGAELYTNPSRDGLLKSNGRPPASVAMTQWSGCMWFGYVRGPYTTAIDILSVIGSTATDGLTGLQALDRTATADGTATLNTLASTASIKVGQLATGDGIPGSSVNIPQGRTVISKTATTVTLSGTVPAGGPFTVTFHDGVTVDGMTYWAAIAQQYVTTPTYPAFAMTVENRSRDTARSLAFVISMISSGVFAYAVEDPFYRGADGSYTQATVVIRSVELDDAAWTVTLIGNTTASLTLPAFQYRANAAGGVLVERDDMPNAIAYSKPGEPEHVPELNFLTVGNENDPIYAFAPLPAALLVLKRDGIFRITGSAPDGWRVDCLEPNARILRGECVDVIDGSAFVWTERGVLIVNEGGAQNISDNAVGFELRTCASNCFIQPSTVAWVRAIPRRNLVIVGAPAADNSEDADTQYVYCTTTQAWTRWVVPLHAATWLPYSGTFIASRSRDAISLVAYDIRTLAWPYAGDSYFGCDGRYTSLTWTNSSGSTSVSIADADRGLWIPEVGDWLSCVVASKTEYRRITAAVDAGASYTLTIATAFTAGSQTERKAYEGIQSKVQWQAKSLIPTDSARVRRMHVALDWTAWSGSVGTDDNNLSSRIVAGMTTDRSATATESTNVFVVNEPRAARLCVIDTTPSKAVARAALYMPYFETDDIGLDWRLLGVTLDVEGVSERADR